jgi:hypothetical protein
MAGSARKPIARLVTVMPTWAPESWVDRERSAFWMPLGALSPSAASRSTWPRSTVTKENSAATKTRRRDQQQRDRQQDPRGHRVALLDAHDHVIRRLVDREHGHVVKSQGDGFMIAFGDPTAAVRVAVGMQRALTVSRRRALRRTPIRVRIGVHAGRVVARDGDYFGLNVAMAARVAALAVGGEILATEGVRAAVEDQSFRLRMPAAQLKGIPGHHQLWSVAWNDG